MDMMRRCRRGRMRICDDPETYMDVTWYWADPAAKPLPHPHSFGSSDLGEYPREFIPIGEERARPIQWLNGAGPVGLTGARATRNEDWWRNGIPPAIAEQDCLCEHPTGLVGGETIVHRGPIYSPIGGGEVAGETHTWAPWFPIGGGELAGETHTWAPWYPIGGGDGSGEALRGSLYVDLDAASSVSGGAARLLTGSPLVPSGAGAAGGEAGYRTTTLFRPAGGGDASGSGVLWPRVPMFAGTCGTCTALPVKWRVTCQTDYADSLCTGCTQLNSASYDLTHTTGCSWESATFAAICNAGDPVNSIEKGVVKWHLFYQGTLTGFRLSIESAIDTLVIFDGILPAAFHCLAPNTFVNPFWTRNGPNPPLCTSTSSVTITPIA